MHNYLLCTLICLLSHTVFGQTDVFFRRAEIFFVAGQPKKALTAYDEALKEANKTNDIYSQVKAMLGVGDAQATLLLLKESRTNFENAIALGEQHFEKNDVQIAKGYRLLAFSYFQLGKFKKSFSYFNLSEELYLSNPKTPPIEIARLYNDWGRTYGRAGQYDKHKECLDKVRQILIVEGHGTPQDIADMYTHEGKYFERIGKYDKQLASLRKAIDTWTKAGYPNHMQVSNNYHMLATNYQYRGEQEQRLYYLQKALAIRLNAVGENHPRTAVTYSHLGSYYGSQKDYEKAITYHEKAIQILIDNGHHENPVTAMFYYRLGDSNRMNKRFETAIELYKKAGNIWAKKFEDKHPYNARMELYMAICYEKLKQPEKAYELYLQSLNTRLKIFGNQHPLLSKNYIALGKHFSKKKDYKKALQYYQTAMTNLSDNFDSQDIRSNPSLDKMHSSLFLLNALYNKGIALFRLYKTQTHDQKDLEFSLETYHLCANLIDSIRISYSSENAKQDLTERWLPTYKRGVQAAYELYDLTQDKRYIEQAFYFAEKSKATVLKEALQDANAKRYSGMPDSLLAKENQFKVLINSLHQQYHESNLKNDTTQMNLMQERLLETSRKLAAFVGYLEQNYPDYFHLKYKNEIDNISDIQAKMNSNSVLIEYVIARRIIYIFAISKNDFAMWKQPHKMRLPRKIRAFRKGLTNFDFIQNSPKEADKLYTRHAFHLYKILLQKIVERFGKKQGIEQLIIVPDGVLGYVPFELLLTQKPDLDKINYKTLPYLIKDYRISYAYSAMLGIAQKQEGKNKKSKSLKSFGGFAPSYDNTENDSIASFRKGYLPLLGAKREVNSIAKLLKGDAWSNGEATEQQFKNIATDYRIVHLSMHGLLDDDNPLYSKLVFTKDTSKMEDNFLTVAELYNLELNAQLAVLSACNSGIGSLKRGEGVMSLSRAFAYAGTPSVVMSLWTVPDETTADLMIDFYGHLDKNVSIDAALRNAKLNYLKKIEDPLYAHPYFWGGFVGIGEMGCIEQNEGFNWWWFLIGIGCFLGIVGLGKWYQ